MTDWNEGYGASVEELRERYERLYTGLLYDALEEHGYPYNVLANDIKPLSNDTVLAGPAFTTKGIITPSRADEAKLPRLELIREMRAPCIEVRDTGFDRMVAHYGELTATTARAHGAIGAVIDGGTRDSRYLLEMGFPVFTAYRNPIEAFGRWHITEYLVPVMLRGALSSAVTVQPGDFVVGDMDGVVIIPKHLVLPILEECEEAFELEGKAREEFHAGGDPVSIYQKYGKL